MRESRADVERTLDAIQDRLSPGQLVDQVARYMRDNGGEFVRNFGDTVRQNPVPVVLVGVGLAWMMLGSRRDVDLPRAADADEYWGGTRPAQRPLGTIPAATRAPRRMPRQRSAQTSRAASASARGTRARARA